jgi:hypothetical protein
MDNLHGMERLIRLQTTLNTLNHSKCCCDDQDQYGYPKCVPLNSIAPIMTPLGEGAWCGIVVGLFQNDQTIPPKGEAFNLPILGLQITAQCNPSVDDAVLMLRAYLLEPGAFRAIGAASVAEF